MESGMYVDVGSQSRALRIREAVPALRETVIRGDAAALDLVPEQLARKHRKALARDSEAWSRADAALASGTATHADLDALYADLREAQAEPVKTSAEVIGWLDANLDALLEAHSADVENAAREALALLAQVEEIAIRISARSQALARARDSNGSKRWNPLGPLKRAGGSSIQNARQGFEAWLPKPDPTFVSPAAYAKLQQGEDAETISGEPLSFPAAEALHRGGLLRVAYGRPTPVARPEQE
jgi:hypothetical protein